MHKEWNNLVLHEDSSCEEEEALQTYYRTVEIVSRDCNPQVEMREFFPKPYWTERLKETRRIREKLYQTYKRSRSIRNAILWKQARAIH